MLNNQKVNPKSKIKLGSRGDYAAKIFTMLLANDKKKGHAISLEAMNHHAKFSVQAADALMEELIRE